MPVVAAGAPSQALKSWPVVSPLSAMILREDGSNSFCKNTPYNGAWFAYWYSADTNVGTVVVVYHEALPAFSPQLHGSPIKISSIKADYRPFEQAQTQLKSQIAEAQHGV